MMIKSYKLNIFIFSIIIIIFIALIFLVGNFIKVEKDFYYTKFEHAAEKIEAYKKERGRYPDYKFIGYKGKELPIIKMPESSEFPNWIGDIPIYYISQNNYWLLITSGVGGRMIMKGKDNYRTLVNNGIDSIKEFLYDPTNGTISKGVMVYDKNSWLKMKRDIARRKSK